MGDVFKKKCVICNRDCSCKVEVESEDELYLLKLLNIESCVGQSKYNLNPFGIYCTDCQHRNSQIVQLYQKIDSLLSDLQEIKQSIEKDFRNGVQNVSPPSYSNGPEIDDPEERYNFLRWQMFKGLNVKDLQQESKLPDPENEDSFNECFSESESISSTFNHDGQNLFESLKETYRLKDLKIVVERIPQNEIALRSSNKNNLENKKENDEHQILTLTSSSEEEEEPVYKTRHQTKAKRSKLRKFKTLVNKKPKKISNEKVSLTCIFDDCEVDGFRLSFATEYERDLHVKQVHDIDLGSEKKTLHESEILSNDNENSILENENSNTSSVFSSKPSESNNKNDNTSNNEIQTISDNNKNKTRSNSTQVGKVGKTKPNKRLLADINKKGKLKCIFSDCIIRKRFRTEKERDKHLKKVHDFERTKTTITTRKEGEEDEGGEDGDDDSSDSDDPNNQYPYAKLQCPVQGCTNRRFWRSERQLAKHHKKAHSSHTKNIHVCPECGRRFRFESEFNAHVDAHAGIFRFICQYCGKGFTTLGYLNVHLPKHTNEKKWKCKVENCGAAFKTSSGLKYHRLNTHENYLAFKCEICENMGIPDKRFISFVKLNNHIKAVHVKEKSHLCQICGKGFTLKMYLATHMKVHKAEETNEFKRRSRGNTNSVKKSTITNDSSNLIPVTQQQQQPPISLTPAIIPQSTNINNNYGLPNFPVIQQSQVSTPSQFQPHEYFTNYTQFPSQY